MARSLAVELGPNKIRVNSLSPGYIMTKYVETYIKRIMIFSLTRSIFFFFFS
jgi:NAD(P)-dependent dehydrogenase (short-subunit alcohol dehydrogenase family)